MALHLCYSNPQICRMKSISILVSHAVCCGWPFEYKYAVILNIYIYIPYSLNAIFVIICRMFFTLRVTYVAVAVLQQRKLTFMFKRKRKLNKAINPLSTVCIPLFWH